MKLIKNSIQQSEHTDLIVETVVIIKDIKYIVKIAIEVETEDGENELHLTTWVNNKELCTNFVDLNKN